MAAKKIDEADDTPAPDIVALVQAEELHAAAIHFLRSLKRFDAESSGLGPAALSALSVIYFMAPLNLKDLAAKEGVKPPTMTRIVASLTDRGLVSRSAEPGDRRQVLLSLTTEGRDVFEAARQARLVAISDALGAEQPGHRQIVDVHHAINAMGQVAARLRGAE